MQEHILSPYNLAASAPAASTIDGHNVQQLGPVREPGDDAADGDRALLRHLLLPGGQALLRPARRTAASRSRTGRRPSASASRPGSTSGRRRRGSLPTIEWRRKTYTKKTDPTNWQIDRLWKSGDSVQLAIGQKDLQVTPLADGALLRARRERRQARDAARRRRRRTARPQQRPGRTAARASRFHPPAKELNLDPPRSRSSATASTTRRTRRSARRPPSSATSRSRSPARRARPRRSSNGVLTRTPSWWCGYGPVEAPTLVVCAVIENGGFGGEAAAPAALQVFESYFGKQAGVVQASAHGLMVDYAATQRVSTRPRARARDELVPAQPRLGHAARRRRARRLRALGDRRDHAPGRHGRPELLRVAPGRLRAAGGRRDGRR